MASTTNGNGSTVVLVGASDGVPVIPARSDLSRLNYFDGKFLRADDLTAEQDYLRRLIQLGNQGGGGGVVAGFDAVRSGTADAIDVSPGLAFDAQGRVLALPLVQSLQAGALVAATAAAQPGATAGASSAAEFADCATPSAGPAVATSQSADLYLLTVGWAEALCGFENVYGKLCEDACSKEKDRSRRLEGVIFRARPLALLTPLVTSTAVLLGAKHLRSRAASAYYADERARVPSLVSGAGLRSATWCLGAAAEVGDEVPLAIFSRSAGGLHWVDAWIARRERMEAPPRRYWAWRMAMRPWPAYLAQILQFQCQLHELLAGAGEGGGVPDPDPCAGARSAIGSASSLLTRLETFHRQLADNVAELTPLLPANAVEKLSLFSGGLAEIGSVRKLLLGSSGVAPTSDRVLVDGGIVELPSAGYLPVVPGAGETVNAQVRRQLGPGVDLRFCLVTPDYVPHALEMRQHMDRISLLDGLADPARRPPVDILVPNGTLRKNPQPAAGTFYDVAVQARSRQLIADVGNVGPAAGSDGATLLAAAGHSQPLLTGGGQFTLAGTTTANLAVFVGLRRVMDAVTASADAATAAPPAAPQATARPGTEAMARFATMAEVARKHLVQLAAAAESPQPARAGTFTVGQPEAATATTTAVYADLRVLGNPFTMGAAQSTPFGLSLLAGAPSQKVLVDLEASGTLAVQVPAVDTGTGGAHAAQMVVSVPNLNLSVTVHGQGGVQPKSVALLGNAELRWASDASGGSVLLTLHLREAQTGKAFTDQSWRYVWKSASPLQGTLFPFVPSEAQPPFSVHLTQDDAVAGATNALHAGAGAALDILAAQLGDPTWRGMAESNLFPPPPAPVDGLDVEGTLDWVLFCRRRQSTCEADIPAAAPQPSRRFQVLAVDERRGDVRWQEVRDAFMKNDAARIAALATRLVPVDVVAFQPGAIAPDDPASAAADWRAKATGNTLLWAGIAMAAPGDPDSVQLNRLTGYESVISTVTSTGGAKVDVVPVLPDAFRGAADGVIVLVTRQVLVQELVYRVDPAQVPAFEKLAKESLFKTAESDHVITPLGAVGFELAGSAPRSGADVVTKGWTDAGGGGIDRAWTSYLDTSTGDPKLMQERASAIQQALGGDGTIDSHPTQAKAGSLAQLVALFLAPKAQLVRGTGVEVFRTAGDAILTEQAIALLRKGDPSVFAAAPPLVESLGTAHFNVGSAAPKGDTGPIAEAWAKAKLQDPFLAVLYFDPSDPNAEDPKLWVQRGRNLEKLTRAANPPQVQVVKESPRRAVPAALVLVARPG